ncbi:MAG: hypothetical protein AAF270_01115 [Pseudomonadota bacterium]
MIDYLPVRSDLLVLALGALLYLIDTGRLIASNELLLVDSAGGRFRAVTPDRGFLFSRRYAVFPGLLRPSTLLIRLRWPTPISGASAAAPLIERMATLVKQLQMPRIICWLLLVEIFVAIPLAYFLTGSDWPLLLVFVIVYLQILGMAVWLMVARKTLGLTLKQSLIIAFESFVCLPYAINFHRKVFEQALHPHRTDPLDAANLLMADADVANLKAHFRRALESYQVVADSPALDAWRTRLGGGS